MLVEKTSQPKNWKKITESWKNQEFESKKFYRQKNWQKLYDKSKTR